MPGQPRGNATEDFTFGAVYAQGTNFIPRLLICFLVSSKPNNQAKQQGITYINNVAAPSSQETNPSYSSPQTQMLQGQPQTSEQFADVDGLLDNAALVSRTPKRLDNEDRNFSRWSKEFTDLWSFPGGDFGFDDLAFMQ
jgi:hypothetical protein